MSGAGKPVRLPNYLLDLWAETVGVADSRFVQDGVDFAELSARRAIKPQGTDKGAAHYDRIRAFVEEEGLEALGEIWGHSSPASLPGSLWRLFIMRHQVLLRSDVIGEVVERGVGRLQTIDPVIVGIGEPIGALAVASLVDSIAEQAFTGRLVEALERAAALARVVSAGLLEWTHDSEDSHDTALSALHWEDLARTFAQSAQREKTSARS